MSTVWKLEKDLCRCCHAEGSFKHLSDPCYQLGQEEIYSDMLQDCLDIKVVPMTGVLSDVTYTICESCVVRLRDAANFKRQVQDCEERFKDMYSKNLIKGFDDVKDEPAFEESDELKQEFQSVDEDDDDAFLNFDDDEDSTEEQDMITIEVEPKAKGKGKAKPKAKAKKEPPAKKPKKEKVKTAIKEESEDIAVAAVSGEKKKGSVVENLRRLPYVLVEEEADSKTYACTLCDIHYSCPYTMKKHITDHHTDVKCAVCNEEFKSTRQKNEHLLKKHNFNKKQCQGEKCVCDYCKKEYSHKTTVRRHISNTHLVRKCPDCPLEFTHADMAVHRNDVHKKLMPTCGVCGWRNMKTSLILRHQRQVHLREKNFACEFCHLTFFCKKLLKTHLIKHNPKKIHECQFCHKKFPRKPSLNVHVKIHTGEKNKVCNVCDMRFVQKASLNYHMVKHHPEAC